MCGIAGILTFGGAIDPAALSRMRDTMRHRGPDDEGLWISPDGRVGLAHRRLSIIDLAPAAAQPMADYDGTALVVFNGEIYNHMDLRRELAGKGRRFKTDHSDTEILVTGYRQWGFEGLLDRLDGMFAFALWDTSSRRLLLARDRVGIKPLYFTVAGGAFMFASEIKALTAHEDVSREPDPMAVYHYLTYLVSPAPMTMFAVISKLPPGTAMIVRGNGGMKAFRYWEPAPGGSAKQATAQEMSREERTEYYSGEVRARLEEAVRKRMMSDAPYGAFLSGGIDSSTNVALMDKYSGGHFSTFTVGFEGHEEFNEFEPARKIARLFSTNHHEVVIGEKDMVGCLGELVYHQDEPVADWVCVPLYFVSKLAAESGVKVVQAGEGADEQFAGYHGYLAYLRVMRTYWAALRAAPLFARKAVAAALRGLSPLHPRLESWADIALKAARGQEMFWSGAIGFREIGKSMIAPPEAFAPARIERALPEGLMPEGYLEADSYNVTRSFLGRLDGVGAEDLARMIFCEFMLRLPELLLMRVDKMTMAHSIEARVPFLDHKLVELTMDIPMSVKIGRDEPKGLLKRAVADLLPGEIVNREKKGFSAPMSIWLKGEFGRAAENEIINSEFAREGLLKADAARELFRRHRAGRGDHGPRIWALFNLAAWRARRAG